MPLHTFIDGTQAYVSDAEARYFYNEKRKYRRGSVGPNFPVPATIGHVLVDEVGVFVYDADELRPNPLTSYWRDGHVDYMEPWN